MNRIQKAVLYLVCVPLLVQQVTVSVEAEETSVVEIPYAASMIGVHGSIHIILQGSRKVNVNIQKQTQEGSDLYYDTVLDPSQSETDTTEYVFYLDCCEYNLSTESYVSTYQLTISDLTTEAASYQEKAVTIVDPGFSESIQTTNYHYTVTMLEGETGGVIATVPKKTVADGVQTVENHITLRYIAGNQLGDPDGDGKISVEDAVIVLTYYAKRSAGLEAEIDLYAADVNGDDVIGVEDAVGILTYYAKAAAGLSPSF